MKGKLECSDFVRYSKLSEDQAEAYYEDRKYKLHKELRKLMKQRSKFFKKGSKSRLNKTFTGFSILRSKMKKAQLNKFVIYNQVFWKKQMNKSAKRAKSLKNSGKSKRKKKYPRVKAFQSLKKPKTAQKQEKNTCYFDMNFQSNSVNTISIQIKNSI